MLRVTSRLRSLAAQVLLAALCLGSGAHLWHHLTDPDCGTGRGPASQPCGTCSTLHGAAVAPDLTVGTAPAQIHATEVTIVPVSFAASTVLRQAAPRAPPVA